MNFYVLCLLVVAATAARPYTYHGEEYKPSRRFSDRYMPSYGRVVGRGRAAEERPFSARKAQESARQQEGGEARNMYARVITEPPKEEVGGYQYPYFKPVVEESPGELKREETYVNYQRSNEQHEDEVEDEEVRDDEIDWEEDEHEAYESKEHDPEYHADEEYYEQGEEGGDDVGKYDDDEEGKDENDEASGWQYNDEYDHEEEIEEKEEKEEEGEGEQETPDDEEVDAVVQEKTPVKGDTGTQPEADKVVFSNCSGITCIKEDLFGYGCFDSKCRFVCSTTECCERLRIFADAQIAVELAKLTEGEKEEPITETATTTPTTTATTTTEATTTPPPPPPPPTTIAAPKVEQSQSRKYRGGYERRENRGGRMRSPRRPIW